MLSNIRNLLRDPALRQSVASAASPQDAVRVIAAAAAARGMPLSHESVAQAVAELTSEKGELTDADLLNVAGGGVKTTAECAPTVR